MSLEPILEGAECWCRSNVDDDDDDETLPGCNLLKARKTIEVITQVNR